MNLSCFLDEQQTQMLPKDDLAQHIPCVPSGLGMFLQARAKIQEDVFDTIGTGEELLEFDGSDSENVDDHA